MRGSGTPLADPISAAWNSDDGFPVEKLDIVGSGLRLVERVTGRLTTSLGEAGLLPEPGPAQDTER